MTDEQETPAVRLFPENFPDWALTPEERRLKRILAERRTDREDDPDAASD